MSDRKLAHIEQVVKVEPIPNADQIEKVTVLGWEVVTRKGTVKEGDFVIYIEVDSIVPAIPYFEFMKERHYRVRTIRLRKQISQGLIVPYKEMITIVNQLVSSKIQTAAMCVFGKIESCINGSVGDDVTDALSITKYESQSDKESSEGTSRKKPNWFVKHMTRYQWFRSIFHIKSKSFPWFVPKTDEERIQNIPWMLDDKTPKAYYVTEKLDGCSATFARYKKPWKERFYVLSRNVWKHENDNSRWSQVFKQYSLKSMLHCYGRNIAIQGEIIGFNIQGNPYRLRQGELKFYVFNVWDIDKRKYYSFEKLKDFCKRYNFDMVPVLNHEYTLSDFKTLVEYSNGKSTLNEEVNREGIVIRSNKEDVRISFKCVSPTYLLKNEE